VLFQSPAMFLTPAIEAATTIGASAHVARRLWFSRRNEAIPFSEHKTAKQLRRNGATGFSAYGSQCSEVEEASGLKRLPLAVGHFTGGEGGEPQEISALCRWRALRAGRRRPVRSRV